MPSWKSIPSAIFLLKPVLEVFPYQQTGAARSLVAAPSSTSFSRVLCVVNQFPVNVLGWGWFPVHLWVWELERHFLRPFLCSPLLPPAPAMWLYLGCSLASSGVLPALPLAFSSGKICPPSRYFLSPQYRVSSCDRCCPVNASFAPWFRCGRKLFVRGFRNALCCPVTDGCGVTHWRLVLHFSLSLYSPGVTTGLSSTEHDSLILASSGWCCFNMHAGPVGEQSLLCPSASKSVAAHTHAFAKSAWLSLSLF